MILTVEGRQRLWLRLWLWLRVSRTRRTCCMVSCSDAGFLLSGTVQKVRLAVVCRLEGSFTQGVSAYRGRGTIALVLYRVVTHETRTGLSPTQISHSRSVCVGLSSEAAPGRAQSEIINPQARKAYYSSSPQRHLDWSMEFWRLNIMLCVCRRCSRLSGRLLSEGRRCGCGRTRQRQQRLR